MNKNMFPSNQLSGGGQCNMFAPSTWGSELIKISSIEPSIVLFDERQMAVPRSLIDSISKGLEGICFSKRLTPHRAQTN